MSTRMSTRSQCKKEVREVSDEEKEKKRNTEEVKPLKDAPSRPTRQSRNKTKDLYDVHHDNPGEQTPAEKKLPPRTRKDIKELSGKELKEDATASGKLTRSRQGKRATREGPTSKKDVKSDVVKQEKEDDDPSSPTRKRTKSRQASSSKTLSTMRSMDSWVDDVTSDVMSDKEPVANLNQEPVSYLKKEPSAYLKKQQSSKLSKKGPNAKFVGAHCSIAGGLVNAVRDAVSIKATSFAMFLRSQRQWHAKPLEENDAKRFREACAEHGFPPHLILPHGSYLLNCGSPNEETLSKSRTMLQDEMSRCEKLGLTLYNFHPGSTCGQMQVEECLDKIAESINMALAKTSGVTAVLENMSCQGNTIGGHFEELRAIIDRVQDKTRVGVCLDTCHAFAAGYDLSTEAGFQQMTSDFDRIVGFKYLRAMHVNDSKGEVGCHLDRHENIGKGKIGLEGFRRVMNNPQFNNIPLILETPPDFGYSREIKTLNSLMT